MDKNESAAKSWAMFGISVVVLSTALAITGMPSAVAHAMGWSTAAMVGATMAVAAVAGGAFLASSKALGRIAPRVLGDYDPQQDELLADYRPVNAEGERVDEVDIEAALEDIDDMAGTPAQREVAAAKVTLDWLKVKEVDLHSKVTTAEERLRHAETAVRVEHAGVAQPIGVDKPMSAAHRARAARLAAAAETPAPDSSARLVAAKTGEAQSTVSHVADDHGSDEYDNLEETASPRI